jgi:PAS domain S-box-containing protein
VLKSPTPANDATEPVLKARGALLERGDIAWLLKGVLATLVIAACAAGGVGLIFGDPVALVAAASMLVVSPLLLLLLRNQHESHAALGTALSLLALSVYVVSKGEGLFDIGMLLFPGVIVISGLLLDQRSFTVMSVLTVLTVTGIGWSHAEGLLVSKLAPRALHRDVFNAAILLTALAAFVRIMTDALYRGLHRAYLTEQTRNEIFQAVAEGIALFDPETGRLLDTNEAARRMLGLRRQNDVDLGIFAARQSPDGERVATVLQRIPEGGELVMDWKRELDDGRRLQAEVVLRRVTLGGQRRVIAVARDVTEQSALRDQIRESEQLRAIGQLAGGVAHDFNNQLTGIVASASMLELELKHDAKLSSYVQMILRCGMRSADLTKELLAFARRGKTTHRAVELHTLIEEVVALLSRSIDKRITIEQRLQQGQLFTLGDASLLENALLNLALNARDAMPGGGLLRIETKSLVVQAGLRGASTPASLPPGEYLQLSVSDTGLGMDAQTRARIFEPFFTTKTRGNGMGLAAVYGTVQSHGGMITVDSTQGAGTTFDIFLPRVSAPEHLDRESEINQVARPGSNELAGLRVLLADDEPDVAQVTAGSLERLGAQVEIFGDGKEALHRFRQCPGDFDLVILDQMMPELSGTQVLSLIRAQQSDVPVLITSGYTGEEQQASLATANALLRKPFSVSELQISVRQLLRHGIRRANP